MRTGRKVAILGGSRTPFVKSFTSYSRITNQQLMTAVLQDLVQKFKLKNEIMGDVALGAIIMSSADWNLARESVLGSGLHPWTPAYNVQRACGTSLETSWQLGLKIAAGQIESAIAGGVDTNSDLPVMMPRALSWKLMELRQSKGTLPRIAKMLGFKPGDFKFQYPEVVEPRTGLSMGEHCELMVKEWQIPRTEQDELALQSHKNVVKAYKEGFFNDLVFEFNGIKRDSAPREDTSLEKLAKLKPAFDKSEKGTLTAGNSSPLTDGAAAVLLGSEDYARQKNLNIMAYLTDVQASALDFVAGDGLLMAPTVAVSELLKRNNLSLQDFDFYEIHEAFAGQVLCTLRAWESKDYCKKYLKREALGSIDRKKLNVNGGSVAVGHPFAATGARIVASLAKILQQKGSGRGLISICTAGGMGVAAILER